MKQLGTSLVKPHNNIKKTVLLWLPAYIEIEGNEKTDMLDRTDKQSKIAHYPEEIKKTNSE